MMYFTVDGQETVEEAHIGEEEVEVEEQVQGRTGGAQLEADHVLHIPRKRKQILWDLTGNPRFATYAVLSHIGPGIARKNLTSNMMALLMPILFLWHMKRNHQMKLPYSEKPLAVWCLILAPRPL